MLVAMTAATRHLATAIPPLTSKPEAPHNRGPRLSFSVEHQHRDSLDVELLGQFGFLVNVDALKDDIALVMLLDLVEDGSQLLAGAAPGGVKVNYHGLRRLDGALLQPSSVIR